MNNKDRNLLEHIIWHCQDVLETKERFGDKVIFDTDKDYFNSVCMYILQIGELANHFTSDFFREYTVIPWKDIIATRNIVVHGYGELNRDEIWDTLCNDIPPLLEYCQSIFPQEELEK